MVVGFCRSRGQLYFNMIAAAAVEAAENESAHSCIKERKEVNSCQGVLKIFFYYNGKNGRFKVLQINYYYTNIIMFRECSVYSTLEVQPNISMYNTGKNYNLMFTFFRNCVTLRYRLRSAAYCSYNTDCHIAVLKPNRKMIR